MFINIINHKTINSPQMRCQQFFLVRLCIYADDAHCLAFLKAKKKPKATADPMVISVQKTPKEMEIISQRCDVPV